MLLLLLFGEFEFGIISPGFPIALGGAGPQGRGVGGAEGFLLFLGAEMLKDFVSGDEDLYIVLIVCESLGSNSSG